MSRLHSESTPTKHTEMGTRLVREVFVKPSSVCAVCQQTIYPPYRPLYLTRQPRSPTA